MTFTSSLLRALSKTLLRLAALCTSARLEDREARLSPEDLAQVLRLGRDAGCHAAVNWLLRACGYEDARPVEPAYEQAELQRQYVAAARSMAAMAARIEALATAPTLRRAA